MSRFYDGQCPNCHTKYGWYGEAADWPPCERCGYHPGPAAVARLAKAGAEGGCSGPAFGKARAWLNESFPDLWQTETERMAELVMSLGRLLDSVAPDGRVRRNPT